ncbi:LON peptidase substrate-binding domain-containing protein [Deinococcus taeanensis]|uniref:LON peptidase substrate-binding domain-containing protein n=1 Tax=Deinococcus taeanensis TaxID=2737050 RepID=UPI001CDC65D5|nr:LON peptidase substrate-binding domain-containing protein [Deinococcus taeanensis]UBV43765.1 LON peptidase substrate-binding domain-containing protein [Deinococcus taeanensis]
MRVPLFPLPNLVLFPGVLLPLYVFEARYRTLLADVQASGEPFGIVRIVESSSESSRPFEERVSRVGTLAYLREARPHEDGTSTIMIVGGERFQVQAFHLDRPYLSADVTLWPLENEPTLPPGVAETSSRELLAALLRLNPDSADTIRDSAPEDPLLMASFVASLLPITPRAREDALQCATLQDRLDLLLTLVPRDAKLLN